MVALGIGLAVSPALPGPFFLPTVDPPMVVLIDRPAIYCVRRHLAATTASLLGPGYESRCKSLTWIGSSIDSFTLEPIAKDACLHKKLFQGHSEGYEN